MVQQAKLDSEMIENSTIAEAIPPITSKGGALLMRSKADDLTVWQSVRRYKRVGIIAMVVAFCASLDGYRKAYLTGWPVDPEDAMLTGCIIEINLNGGIISNKGFIQQMASPGTTIIAAPYISAWGGIQSAGQVVGQVVRGAFKA
jgi:MFS transporter, SP family, general alpha glucoside:H+ symporter